VRKGRKKADCKILGWVSLEIPLAIKRLINKVRGIAQTV